SGYHILPSAMFTAAQQLSFFGTSSRMSSCWDWGCLRTEGKRKKDQVSGVKMRIYNFSTENKL
ncbi:hypothetical protein NDU88_004491, partial [Pleurodeles waltl]